jgi:hypothetical protein
VKFRALIVAAGLLAACYGPDPDVTASGAARPAFEIDFPAESAPGSTQTATLTITNPGPGDMAAVVVAFARVGPAEGGAGLPTPIVDGGFKGRNPAVADIRPDPRETSQAAMEFFFGPLAERETTTIEFDLVVPEVSGEAANSVTVYDGSDPDRIRGARLSTEISG